MPLHSVSAIAVLCLGLNVYHEAGSVNEPITNQFAVAFVTINRARENGTDVCQETFRRKQFSWTNHAIDAQGRLKKEFYPHGKMWKQCKEVARIALKYPYSDFTRGANFFHATYIKPPNWTKKMEKVGVIGHHIFYRLEDYGKYQRKNRMGRPRLSAREPTCRSASMVLLC